MKKEKANIAAGIAGNITEISKALAVLGDHNVLSYAFLVTQEKLEKAAIEAKEDHRYLEFASYLFGAQAALENLEDIITVIEQTR